MNDLMYLIDLEDRTEIRNKAYNGVRDIEKIREQAEETIQRMVNKFINDLTWQRTNLPTDGVEDTKVEAILKHLLTYSKECKDDMISDLADDLAEQVQDKLVDYIDDNVSCTSLRDIVYEQVDCSTVAYEFVEDTIERELKKLKAPEETTA